MIARETFLALARRYGTPLFVYDGDLMLERYADLFRFIPADSLRIHYALKANYNPALLSLLRDAGAGIDAVSPAEVELALAIGFAKDRIIYTANNMTDAEFAKVMGTGVTVNIGSLSRLKKCAREFPGRRICLRFNPDVRDGDSAMTMTGGDLTKFGILLDCADEAAAIAASGGLHVTGLHEHTGSGLQHAESVLQSMDNLMGIATSARFPELEFLDFGGGFKVPYRDDEPRIDYVDMGGKIAAKFAAFCAGYGRKLLMRFEPGKYLSAECGTLIVEVNTIKHNRSRVIAGCNSGFPQLIRPVLYGAYHKIVNLSNPDGRPAVYDVCGNICETGDRFAEQRELPEIREYDLLAIGNAGAYCYSMGSVYNLRPMPAEVVVKGGEVFDFRPAESDTELVNRVLDRGKGR
ncbi:MAG: diaminopimelate decarboxylase [Lentisphaeria bacterium]|nr:diaminopimelate decarboxylase [Lentisphaeria bacterium]